jgi:uncharacterized membrane protein
MVKETKSSNFAKATGDKTKTSRDLDVELNKTVAALSYVWILCLVPLLTKRDSEYVQFHAKQGLVLFIASFLCWFPIIGWLLSIVILVLSVMGVLKTLSGEWWEAPVIFEWSKRIKL